MASLPKQPPSFSELLTPQADLAAIIRQAAHSLATEAPRIDLLYLRFLEATPDEAGFAEMVCHQVVNYALPRRKIKDLVAKTAGGALDMSSHSKLLAEARRAFIAYNQDDADPKNNRRYAEIGEVIAFCVASHYLQAGQVAAKMALKTNSEMPVYGLDGIHIRAEEDGTVTVFFMEAKMVSDAESGGKQYAKSAAGFDQDRDHKLNEKRIARDLSNLDILEEVAKGAALDYFDPYHAQQSAVRERFVGVVIHDEPAFKSSLPVTDATPVDAHEKHFLNAYKQRHSELSDVMKKALELTNAEAGRCRTFFLAVPDVAKLKRLFAAAMMR